MYIDKMLKRFNMDGSKNSFFPMCHGIILSRGMSPKTQEEHDRMNRIPYTSAIGSIMYAMLCTRYDVSYALSDNNGAITQLKEPRSHNKSKHIL